jgi:hypothetical protein
LLGTLLLLLPRVGRGRPASKLFVAAQCLCGLAIAGAVGAAVAGIVLNAGVGTKAQFLEDGSCVGFSFFQCLPTNASPNGCTVEASSNGTRLLFCPSVHVPACWLYWLPPLQCLLALLVALLISASGLVQLLSCSLAPVTCSTCCAVSSLLAAPQGSSQALPSGISVSSGDADTLTQLCLQYCAAELGSGTDDAGGGSSGGGGTTGSPPGADNWSSRPPPAPKAGAVPVPAGGGGAVLLSTGVLD